MSEIDDESPEYWPRAGDRLFVQSSYAVDAHIARFPGERLYRMKNAFKSAGDLLVSHSEENPHERRNLVWPVIFCYRHYIELALKDMVNEHGSKVRPSIEPNWTNHELMPLWNSYKRLIDTTLFENRACDLPEVIAVEGCISEFDQIDGRSFTFRYPTDTKGKQTNIPHNSIDLWHLRTVMERIYVFLDCTETVLDEYFKSQFAPW